MAILKKNSKNSKNNKKKTKNLKQIEETSDYDSNEVTDSLENEDSSVDGSENPAEQENKNDEESEINAGSHQKTSPIPDYVSETLVKALKEMEINSLFEVQSQTIGYSIQGSDLIVQARTGSGKTLAFALPTLERLISSGLKFRPNQPRVLVLAPTRELATQIDKVFNKLAKYTGLKSVPVYGGVSYFDQKRDLAIGKNTICTGTPGRVKDMINNGHIDLSKVKVVILDEVDRMLDMGFADDVEEILNNAPYDNTKSQKPQTLFYSATCPDWVKEKCNKYMVPDYQHISLVDEGVNIGGASTTVEHLSVQIDRYDGVATCVRDLVRLYSAGRTNGRAIVFTKTKKEANDLALGDVAIGDAQVMHGDIEQKQREVTLKGFREGKFRCLVATDVAARGLDIPQIDLVVQTSPPLGGDIESYIHRSGRTGRAGKKGVCVCIYNFKNKRAIKDIEKMTGVEFRDVPIPQPIDVAKSVLLEKLESDLLSVVSDPEKRYEEFTNISSKMVELCSNDKDKAISCLLTYIAQGNDELNTRSMISGQEGFQTWLLETDNPKINSPVGLIKSILLRNNIDAAAINEIKTWRQYAEKTTLGGAGVAFDVDSKYTKEINASWEDGTIKKSYRESVLLKKCGKMLPKLQDFKSKFGSSSYDYRGGGRGGGRDFRRNNDKGGNRFNQGQKRSFSSRSDSRPQRGGKKHKNF